MVLDREVMVCSACKQASCWHGTFLCDEAQVADIEPMTVQQLHELARENPEYWFKNPATGEIDRQGLSEYLQVTGKQEREHLSEGKSGDDRG